MVLDLFAGSGAGGDRGAVARARRARSSWSNDAGAARAIAENLRRTRLEARGRVVRRDAIALARLGPTGRPRTGRSTSSSSTRRTRTRARSCGRSSSSGRTSRPAGASSPSTSGGTRRRRGRAASIRAGAALRRDGADVLPARGGRRRARREGRGLSGLVRPDHERPPRRRPPRGARLRPGRRRGARQPAQVAAARRRRTGRGHPGGDRRGAGARRARRGPRRSTASRSTFCREVGAGFLVRGLRAIADFEAELQLAHNNHQLAPDIDTVFFMTSLEHSYVSSSLVKEIAQFGGRRVVDGARLPPLGRCARRCRRARGSRSARAIIGRTPRRGPSAREAVRWTSSFSSSASSR